MPAPEPGATSRKMTAGVCRAGQVRCGFRKIRRKLCGNDEHCQIPAAALFATLLVPDAGPSPRLPPKGDCAMARISAFTLRGAPRTDTIRTLILNVQTRPVAAVSRNTEDGAGIICQAEGCPEFQEGPSCRRAGGPLRTRRRPRQEPERVK
jgi:hypothetical protein